MKLQGLNTHLNLILFPVGIVFLLYIEFKNYTSIHKAKIVDCLYESAIVYKICSQDMLKKKPEN